MKKTIYTTCLLSLIFLLTLSCEKNIEIYKKDIVLELPDENFDYINGSYKTAISEATRQVPQLLKNTGVTNEGAKLGRVLFYDTQLSLNNRVSCASCHEQSLAFSDSKAFSVGFETKVTPRNSMAIVNPIVNNSLFWDSRASSIEDLISEPIKNHIEMGMESMESLVRKLKTIEYYDPLFEEAYGDRVITEKKVVDAMSQFLRSMVSMESKFDTGAAKGFTNYSELELKGKEIFFSKDAQCSSCHKGINFSAPDGGGAGARISNDFIDQSDNGFGDSEYAGPEIMGTANIGLDVVYSDNGFGQGQFKIPTLRNIELTAPYMHDGRYATLEEVVDHYSSNIQLHNNLDDKFLEAGQVKHLNFNDREKSALVAFLKTLTDQEFVTAERFSDPFIR
ncbi:cytochrome-c peroxidase [Portibacter marinus]|uniref:cytochrome-c peroxidase n=1 Tax=Portibacter marinus TaxID=2898660 RepID=UPI0029E80266|nr:cytochrome c peroxidase [Portibacter marinus]